VEKAVVVTASLMYEDKLKACVRWRRESGPRASEQEEKSAKSKSLCSATQRRHIA
jgi:hypothetical protein